MPDSNPPKRRGRPRIDDFAFILDYVIKRVRTGLPVAQAVKGGLYLLGQQISADGTQIQNVVRRFIPASTLLRRYNMYIETVNEASEEMAVLLERDDTRLKGMATIPAGFLSFSPNPPLKRGRPKKRPNRRTE